MTRTSTTKPRFFATPAKFRAWLRKNHRRIAVLWVGFYRKASGRPSITWPESVDQALCFGWIDGLRKGIDEARYMIRFTPRRPGSIWSTINIRRAKELRRLGLMSPAGLRAFQKRVPEKSVSGPREQRRNARLTPAQEREFRANPGAWRFFDAQPAWYKRTAVYWVVSAKKEETRARRLAALIEDSAARRSIGPLQRNPQKQQRGSRRREPRV